MSIESVIPSNHLILCCSLLLLPSVVPSIRVFSNESALRIKWPKYWSFSISSSNGYSGLISFKDWLFDLLAVQGILKSLLQHHSLKASICWRLSLLCSPTLTFVYDNWENHSSDYLDHCQKSLCFLKHCLGLTHYSSKEHASFSFVYAVTICIDFGAQ